MPIEDRDLKSGTRLAARYKGREYAAEVVQGDGSARYRLEDGREFKSPSSAGRAVMGGAACNGWRFWSLAPGEAIKAKAGKRRGKGRTKNAPRAFERLEDGSCFCGACGEAFEVADDQVPVECPSGHRADGLAAAAV